MRIGADTDYRSLSAFQLPPGQFADAAGISRPQMHYILHGKSRVSPATALRFEKSTGVAAEQWLGIQARHEIDILRDELAADLSLIKAHPFVDATRLFDAWEVEDF
ncbi:hypothetical protein SH584_09945 [Sphingomonas sp. LY29]|uniref:helix-turn-helix transcriptional regulator n=1 Tax=Sphingomonas sp. LY29 TaxID=3095341 RepID=UPI002D765175|nr:hypothetical protein [Sphingomonas sp. LY29]WRP25362.1 hypothetical protein SH584_09945 [Sphingomonas sp. LY29]